MMKWKCLAIFWMVLFCAAPLSAEQKTVTLATLEWEPYVGSEMAYKGMTAEIVTAAFQKAGYTVHFKFQPWAEGLAAARKGDVDGIFPAYDDASRRAAFVFSDKLMDSPLGLYKRSSKTLPGGPGAWGELYEKAPEITFQVDPRIDQTEALKGLKDFSFGVVSGYVNTPEIDAADFLTKVEAENDLENLKNLFEGKVQLIVIDRYVAKSILVKKFPWQLGEFDFMEPPLEKKPLYVIFSKQVKGHEEMLKDFNAGLALVKADGMLKEIMRKYGLQ
jgi:ABC-type amino acid transport substrate-binding protein